MAFEWNIGIDMYTTSSGDSAKRSASMTPGPVIFACVQRTAFGSPLVPDVKMSMNRSSGAAASG